MVGDGRNTAFTSFAAFVWLGWEIWRIGHGARPPHTGVMQGADEWLIGNASRGSGRPSRDGWGARISLGAADIGHASFDV
jgi:hypothetical protein